MNLPENPPAIGILDYGSGNVRSVEKAIEKVGGSVVISGEGEELAACDGLIIPGVGAFPEAMKRIREREFDLLVGAHVAAAKPLLGICLGMQLLFESSAEHGGAWGLGLLQGRVDPLVAPGLKLPQIGWNTVNWTRKSELVRGIPDPGFFYFANSFAAQVVDSRDLLGSSEYGSPFTAVVERAPVYGAQFHPEKSSTHGLALLSNFVSICSIQKVET